MVVFFGCTVEVTRCCSVFYFSVPVVGILSVLYLFILATSLVLVPVDLFRLVNIQTHQHSDSSCRVTLSSSVGCCG